MTATIHCSITHYPQTPQRSHLRTHQRALPSAAHATPWATTTITCCTGPCSSFCCAAWPPQGPIPSVCLPNLQPEALANNWRGGFSHRRAPIIARSMLFSCQLPEYHVFAVSHQHGIGNRRATFSSMSADSEFPDSAEFLAQHIMTLTSLALHHFHVTHSYTTIHSSGKLPAPHYEPFLMISHFRSFNIPKIGSARSGRYYTR
mmetsp:Transcript_24674/g.39104  ORF Transcript_24674/g.39104 Transcript_24674/m.39104 type:complete len:203 (+) Transcript_24674:183-791(+)